MSKPMQVRRHQWLKRRGITKKQFAEAVGQDVGTIYKWFDSKRTPRRLYLQAVLAVFPDWPHVGRSS